MSSRDDALRASEWLEHQLNDLAGIRNATQRDPSFKNWRQATLTVMQRIWPDEQDRSERFRRIPFSPADPRADSRMVREWYSRGCQEAARVLQGFIDDIREHGVPNATASRFPDAQATEFEDGFPTVDLPSGDLGATTTASDKADNMLADLADMPPQGSDPSSPVPAQLRLQDAALSPGPGASPASAFEAARPARKPMSVKARLLDLLGLAHLSAKALAGFPREIAEPSAVDPRAEPGVMPLGEDVGGTPRPAPPPLDVPASPAPSWPILQRPASDATNPGSRTHETAPLAAAPLPPAPISIPPVVVAPSATTADSDTTPSVIMTKPTTLRTSIEKVSIESLIDPAFRTTRDEGTPTTEDASLSATTEASTWPTRGAAPPSAPAEPETPPAASAAFPRPSLKLVPPVFNDPEFSVGPESETSSTVPEPPAATAPARPAPVAPAAKTPAAKRSATRSSGSKIVPLPPPPVRTPVREPEAVSEQELDETDTLEVSSAPPTKVDSEAFARATEDFMRSSPVLGATGRRVQRGFEDPGFGDADAIAVDAMAQDLTRMAVPIERQPEVRARLMDLARRIERGDLEWSALRKAVWFAMEYPELARRLMPVLLPWIDRAA